MIDLDGNEVLEQQEEVVAKRKRVSLFDWLNDLNSDKKGIFNETTAADFSTFMINRGLSQNVETIMYANELNKHWHITKEMAYDFYFYAIPKKKRYTKWSKASNDNKEELDLIVKHYNVNRVVALEYLKVLTSEDIENIKEQYVVGGKSR